MFLQNLATQIRDALPTSIDVPKKSEQLFLLYELLAKSKGTSTTLSDIHDAWCIWMLAQDTSHEALVPFDKLPPNLQSKDEPFLSATLQIARQLELSQGSAS